MSFVAGLILLNIKTELESFICFANLMQRNLLFDFYSFNMERVNIIFHVFMNLLKSQLPKLHKLFMQAKLSCSIFLFEWVVTIFANIFPLSYSAKLWDNYLFYGDHYLIKVAVAICACL